MTAQVIYLNRWLDCGDEELRKNNLMQTRINEAKAVFWHDIKELRINQYQAMLCYDRFIHSNRDRIKVVIDDENEENDRLN